MFPEQYNNTGMIKAHAIFGELKSRTTSHFGVPLGTFWPIPIEISVSNRNFIQWGSLPDILHGCQALSRRSRRNVQKRVKRRALLHFSGPKLLIVLAMSINIINRHLDGKGTGGEATGILVDLMWIKGCHGFSQTLTQTCLLVTSSSIPLDCSNMPICP